MKKTNSQLLDKLIAECNAQIRGIEQVAKKDTERAFGGVIRAGKGGLVEDLCRQLTAIAWNEIGGDAARLSFPKQKIAIPLKKDYLKKIKSPEVKNWIKDNYADFVFHAQVDVHVFVDDKFVLGIECKAFTENAMVKRILVDFSLLKTVYPHLNCALLQLESQLTGDYSQIDKPIIYGSHSTHTLMSYFDIDLHIITLINGERKVDEPIHNAKFFKPLERKPLIQAIDKFAEFLQPYSGVSKFSYSPTAPEKPKCFIRESSPTTYGATLFKTNDNVDKEN